MCTVPNVYVYMKMISLSTKWGLPGQVRVCIVPSVPLTKIFVLLILTLSHFKERILPTDGVILPLLFLAKEATAVGFLQKRIGQGKCRHPWMITIYIIIAKNIFMDISTRDGRGSFFFHGAGRGNPLPPHSSGRGGEGVKICGAGRGRGGEHTVCTD